MFRVPRRRAWLSAALVSLLLASWGGIPVSADAAQVDDPADDAYRYPEPVGDAEPKPPNPLFSNDAADVVNARFVTATPPRSDHQRAYTVSVTVSGQPHETFNYLVGGLFGEDCYLIHFLRAGETRKALAMCGSGDEFRQIGTITGSKVTVNGQTISATFSFRKFTLPGSLRQEPEIGPLYVLTCPVTKDWWGCNDDVLDYAYADAKFRI